MPAPVRTLRILSAALVAGAFVVSLATMSASAASIEGTIRDATESAVPAVSVRIAAAGSDESWTTQSDAEGRFQFRGLTPGEYRLTARAPGLVSGVQAIRLTDRDQQDVDIVLEMDALTEQVTVTASPQSRLEIVAPVTVILRDEIANRSNRRLGDVLQRMAGVYMTGPPGQNQDIRLRGMDKEFTRTQLDGVQLPGAGEKRELQVNRLGSHLVESVRIVRNPTADLESDGIAGRVDVRTRPIPEQLQMDGRIAYGGQDSLSRDLLNAALAVGFKPVDWFGARVVYDQLNNELGAAKSKVFSNGKGEFEDELNSQRSPNLYADLGFFREAHAFHIKPMWLELDRQKHKTKLRQEPGKASSRESEFEDKLQRTTGLTLTHQYSTFSGWILDTQGGYYATSEVKDKTKEKFKSVADGFVLDKTEIAPEDKEDAFWNLSSSAARRANWGVQHELKFGGMLRFRDRFRNKTKQEINAKGAVKDRTGPKDDYTISEGYQATFIQDRLHLTERLSLLPGVRMERVHLDAAAGDGFSQGSTFLDVNPSLHGLFRLRSNVSLRAAVSRGLNRPKFDELSPFEDEKDREIVIGNPNLEPARSWNYDVGGEWLAGDLLIGWNLFHRQITGVIERVDTGFDRDGKDIFSVQNVGHGWTRGIELEQRYRLQRLPAGFLHGLTFWSNQTFLGSRLTQSDGVERRFKQQPNYIFNVGFDYVSTGRGPTMSVSINRISDRTELKPNGDVKTIAARSTVDAAFYQPLWRGVDIFVEGNNLGDARRIETEQFIKGDTSLRREDLGRTVLVGLRWRL